MVTVPQFTNLAPLASSDSYHPAGWWLTPDLAVERETEDVAASEGPQAAAGWTREGDGAHKSLAAKAAGKLLPHHLSHSHSRAQHERIGGTSGSDSGTPINVTASEAAGGDESISATGDGIGSVHQHPHRAVGLVVPTREHPRAYAPPVAADDESLPVGAGWAGRSGPAGGTVVGPFTNGNVRQQQELGQAQPPIVPPVTSGVMTGVPAVVGSGGHFEPLVAVPPGTQQLQQPQAARPVHAPGRSRHHLDDQEHPSGEEGVDPDVLKRIRLTLKQVIKDRAVAGCRVYVQMYQEPPMSMALDSWYQKNVLRGLHPNVHVIRHGKL